MQKRKGEYEWQKPPGYEEEVRRHRVARETREEEERRNGFLNVP
jgi:hypothetical protein